MSLKLLLTFQVIIQLTSILHIEAIKTNDIYKQYYSSKDDINEKKSQNEDASGDSSAKNDKKITKTNKWNVVVKDLNMIDDQHDKETIEALEEGEMEGVQWDPLAKDISYKILVKQGKKNEHVSVTARIVDEDITTWSSIKKSKFRSEEFYNLFRKKKHDNILETDSSPHFKLKLKESSLRQKNRNKKNKELKKETKKKGNHNEALNSRKSHKKKSFLDAYLEDQKESYKNDESSLKSEETKLLEKQNFIINRSEEATTKDFYIEKSEIKDLNWGNEKNPHANDTNETYFLNSIDDKYETLLQELRREDIQQKHKGVKQNRHRNKKKKKKHNSQSETLEEIQQVKNYIKKEVEDLKTTYDKKSPETPKATEKIKTNSNEKQVNKDKTITEHWVPIKSDGKKQWIKEGSNNFTKLHYFVPKTRRRILKIKKVRKKKNRKKISLSKEKESDKLKNKQKHETYLININLQGVTDTNMPLLEQPTEDIKPNIENKATEINQPNDNQRVTDTNNQESENDNIRKKYFTQVTVRTTTVSSKNMEIDISNSYAKNFTHKIVAKRQSFEKLRKSQDDKNIGHNLLYHFDDFSSPEVRDRQTILTPMVNFQRKHVGKKKKRKNVNDWFANTKNETVSFFSRMGRKIKKFFKKKNHAHQTHLNTALPLPPRSAF